MVSFTATRIFIFSGYSNESQNKNFLLYRNFSAHIFIIEHANFTAAKYYIIMYVISLIDGVVRIGNI